LNRLSLGLVLIVTAALPAGCPPEDFRDAFPTTLDDVNEVLDDDGLTAQEQRLALRDLGLFDETINALLRDERTNNQFGGDLRSAYTKVANDRYIDLTPDEVQLYADAASSVDPDDDIDYTLTDSEGLAIADFFEGFGLDSADELEAFLDTPGSPVPNTIPDGVLRDVFVDFDPEQILPLLD
jgi:hypothetical protein